MKTVADPRVLRSLIERLSALRPDSQRRWGTLTPHEMLCHLGDSNEMVLGIRPRNNPVPPRRRIIMKLLGLWSPFRWPHGWRTNPQHDPRADGTRPSEFARDLQRAIAGIEGIARAGPDSLDRAHGFFGVMAVADWQRWAYKHTDHHLRQFGA
ncbi:MAG: DinB family protein [Gemmatimonadaceae bacterium]